MKRQLSAGAQLTLDLLGAVAKAQSRGLSATRASIIVADVAQDLAYLYDVTPAADPSRATALDAGREV